MSILRVNTLAGIGSTTFGPVFGGKLEYNSQNYVILPKGTSAQKGVLRDVPDVVGTGGTYYDNLVLAMPFNTASGFNDVSSRNRNPGVYGDVSISSTISKYYGSSVRFDGSGDYLRFSGIGSDFAFDTGNFTIEGYFYTSSVSSTMIPIALTNTTVASNSDAGWYIRFISSKVEGNSFSGSSLVGVTTSGTLSNNTWYHIAYVRNGSTFTLYIDGSSVSTSTSSSSLNFNPTWKVDVGSGYGELVNANYFTGHIQDLRVYKGIAKYTANFTPPDRIADVDVGFKPGALRYNTDSNKVELYDGSQWTEVQASRPDLNGGARGVFAGGYTNTPANGDSNSIEYINISSSGNSIDFGDLSWLPRENAAVSSSTRGVWCGGYGPVPTLVTTQGYITISSTGNSTSFGSLSQARRLMTGGGNATRGLIPGGFAPGNINVNTIDAITIATTGSNFDFGDLLNTIRDHATFASPTRCILGGGSTPSAVNRIEYITIATQGNSTDFGDLTSVRAACGGGSNATRGIFAGGGGPSATNIIDYVQISTIGNAVRFGDLTQSGEQIYNLQTSSTRGVRCGGNVTPGFTNTMDYLVIQTQGNAVDFGDLIIPRKSMSGCSNAHGGL